MARTEARLLTTIWSDDEFLDLSSAAQRMFMFLLSQDDLAHSGVIALRERRWSRKAADLTVGQVTAALEELDRARFLIVDWDEEEVCVRSLIRRDRIFKQPNVMRSAIDHVPLVQSARILDGLKAEMQRINAENPDLTEHQRTAMGDMTKALEERVTRQPLNPSPNPSGNPSTHPTAATPGERGSSTAVSSSSPSPVPRAFPLSAGDASRAAPNGALALVADDPGPEPRTAQEIVGWWIDQCTQRPPKNVLGQMAKQIKQLLADGYQPLDIRRGITEWTTRDCHPSVLPSVVHNLVNGRPRAAPSRPSTTDQRVVAALALDLSQPAPWEITA